MDGVEEGTMELVEQAERLERVEDGGVVGPALVEHGGNPTEFDILRQRFQPCFDLGFEVVAVNAAVPEELEHLDLVRRFDRLRRIELEERWLLRERKTRQRRRCGRGGEREDKTAATVIHC